jgi:hypothetical protein
MGQLEEATDVGIEHPAHLLAANPDTECVECVVYATSRSESVREAEEVHLIDVVQNQHDGALDQLVLQSGDAEWSLASVRLGYEYAPDWLRSIRSAA